MPVGILLRMRSRITTSLVQRGNTATLLNVLTRRATRATRDSGALITLAGTLIVEGQKGPEVAEIEPE